METTVGQVIINDMLPEDMRDYNRVWDKKTKGKVLTDLVRRHPDQFKEVSQNLLRFGAKAAYETGGQSFSADDITPTKVSKEFQKVMGQDIQRILRNAYRRGKTSADPEVQQEIADAAIPWMSKIDKGIDKELGYNNPFYRQAFGTGAQKPGTLRSIVGADVFYVDQNNRRVPIPVTHGYAQGLTPAEYFIQSFGTRKGMVDLQKATQDAGFLCLAKGTQVRMADMTVKQIEHIEEGDMVWGIEDDLDNPKGKPVKVTKVFDNGLRNCYKTVFAGNVVLISTLRHKVLANNGKEHNEIIPVGASKDLRIQTIQGRTIPIKEQKVLGRLHTYDIEVDSPNHLFVLANGLIVSNSKQLVQIAHRLVVTDKDDPDEKAYDPNMPIGYPVETDDPDNEGSFLAQDVGGYTRNTLLTPKILGDLKSKGFKNILIRSVMVGGPANGGVYAYDCGIREKGRLPTQGDFVGINAVQAISEPLTQGAISCLHPKTKVRMADGTVKAIEDIVVGDMVLGSNKDGFTEPTKVTNVFHNGIQPVYVTTYRRSVKTKAKIAIASTLEHKALQITQKSMCKGEIYNNIIRELPIGEPGRHVSAVLARGPVSSLSGKEEPGALLLGLLLGDGCYTECIKRPYFSCADPSLITELEAYMKSVDCRFVLHKGSQCYYRVSGYSNDGSGNNTINPARKLLQEYNMFGKYSFEKEIPEDVKNWSSSSVSALISGLIITDGSIFKSNQAKHYHLSYGSTSFKLVKQLRDLLYQHCGASCARIHHSNSGRKRTLYSIVYSKPAEILRVLNFIKLYGVKEPLRLKAIEECTALLNSQPYYACKRISQKFLGNIETIDIEVEHPDHLFVLANGMIVSNSKHSGGVAGADSGKAISGFKYINQLIQVPKHFQGGATHAETDGVVGKIENAPQGGKYIYINGIQHYVGRTENGDIPLKIKSGDRVEAGDVLTEGIPNPAMIVKYKGIGEGRRYFTNMFRDALNTAGTPVHRRNIEALSRGLINYVRLNEEVGDYAPDDVIPYSMIEKDYKPREGARLDTPTSLENCYLERPVLHYSIGTQLRPSVIKELQSYGIKQVCAHKDPPPFESEMIRGMAHVSYDPDWATRLLGAYNKESLLEGARRGATSSMESTSYVPAIAFGNQAFGHVGPLKQASFWDNIMEQADKIQ